MCGIAGLVSTKPISSGDIDWMNQASEILEHRGPDSHGKFLDPMKRGFLVHRRLAIRDLSEEGHQPMSLDDNSVVIVFNGEIYNFAELREDLHKSGHTFRSQTDTEVILKGYAEWGYGVVDRLVGAFAFGIFNNVTGDLFLARDRIGEKPLYFAKGDGELAFASELKALSERPKFIKEVNRNALHNYLSVGYGLQQESMIDGISKLPPAHYLTWNGSTGSFRIERYWSRPALISQPLALSHKEKIHLLDEHLRRAVTSQLTADVPVGVLLSGGLDSSLITSYAAESATEVNTYTVTFSGHDKFDEGQQASIVAKHFHTNHTELDGSGIGIEILDSVMKGLDDPIADSSAIPTFLISQLLRKHCTVALGGDGGDEVFGGYVHYQHLLHLTNHLKHVPLSLREKISTQLLAFTPLGMKGRYWLSAYGTDLGSPVPSLPYLFDTSSMGKILKPEFQCKAESDNEKQDSNWPISEAVSRAQFFDLTNYLPEDILVKVDRMSMQNSLEVRAPMLDVNLIEFVSRNFTAEQLVSPNGGKLPLREIAKNRLPHALNIDRKQGFSVPIRSWIQNDIRWKRRMEELLLESDNSMHNREFAVKLLKSIAKGRDTSQQIYSLAILELWRRKYLSAF